MNPGIRTTSAKDKLASKWNKPDSNAVIVDVDCTTDDAKDLCNKYGVQGYPTLKYFSPTTSKDGDVYEDARDLKAPDGDQVEGGWRGLLPCPDRATL